MITSHSKIDLKLHECSSNSDIVQRITDYLLSIPVDQFYSTKVLSDFRVFTSNTDFTGFIFHEHAITMADLEAPCNNQINRNSNLPNLKEDLSYAFIPRFVPPHSGIMPISVMMNVIQNLKNNGFHLSWEYDQHLFGK